MKDYPTPLMVQHTLNPSVTFFQTSFSISSLSLTDTPSPSQLSLSRLISLWASLSLFQFVFSQPPPPTNYQSCVQPSPLVLRRPRGAAPPWAASLPLSFHLSQLVSLYLSVTPLWSSLFCSRSLTPSLLVALPSITGSLPTASFFLWWLGIVWVFQNRPTALVSSPLLHAHTLLLACVVVVVLIWWCLLLKFCTKGSETKFETFLIPTWEIDQD